MSADALTPSEALVRDAAAALQAMLGDGNAVPLVALDTYDGRSPTLADAEAWIQRLGAAGWGLMPCEHLSATGADQSGGPDKVWRCDGCGWLYRDEPTGDGFSTRMVPA